MISTKNNRERVREHRKIRIDAGLKEVKLWVCESDVSKLHKALSPFLQRADKVLQNFKKGSSGHDRVI